MLNLLANWICEYWFVEEFSTKKFHEVPHKNIVIMLLSLLYRRNISNLKSYFFNLINKLLDKIRIKDP